MIRADECTLGARSRSLILQPRSDCEETQSKSFRRHGSRPMPRLLLCGAFVVFYVGLTAAQTFEKDLKITLGVRTQMRDGVQLVANIFQPSTVGKFPAILVRTPYGRDSSFHFQQGRFFAQHGYVYVVQDCRGRHDSDGVFRPQRDEARDGYDTVEWVAAQPWSDGNVGTLGNSYLGMNQWEAATLRPPHLRTMIPVVSPPDPFYALPYQRGAFSVTMLDWANFTSDHDNQPTVEASLDAAYRHLPLIDMDDVIGRKMQVWHDWVHHSTLDEYWKAQSFETQFDKIDLPVLNISGWYDDVLEGTLLNFTGMRQLGRKNQKMIIGPWPHNVNSTTRLGILDFGATAQVDLEAIYLRWFDRWLKGIPNNIENESPVRIFVMGQNTWRDEQDWPLPATDNVRFYLHSNGRATSITGDGFLSRVPPSDDAPDHYAYDPADPTPFITPVSFKQVGGPDDYRTVEERDDVLVFTSPPLRQDIEVTGPLSVSLYAASSAPDTDFTAMFLDVYPDGYALRLNDGIVRARFRDSLENPSLIVPGKIYQYTIDCSATSMLFGKGHRLRLQIASSAFPKFDRNLNSGHALGLDAEFRVAHQVIYHDRTHLSYVTVPIHGKSRNLSDVGQLF